MSSDSALSVYSSVKLRLAAVLENLYSGWSTFTGILPLTSVVTTVRHDSHERVQVLRAGWSLPQDIALAQLPDYVTEQGETQFRNAALPDFRASSFRPETYPL